MWNICCTCRRTKVYCLIFCNCGISFLFSVTCMTILRSLMQTFCNAEIFMEEIYAFLLHILTYNCCILSLHKSWHKSFVENMEILKQISLENENYKQGFMSICLEIEIMVCDLCIWNKRRYIWKMEIVKKKKDLYVLKCKSS